MNNNQSVSKEAQNSMNNGDLELTITEAQRQFARGELSWESVVRNRLERASSHPELNLFTHLATDYAVAEARRIDAIGPSALVGKPLAGVPIVVKDNIHVAGQPTAAATPALRNFVPRKDSPAVAEVRAAGAVLAGKTNMHELAFGATGYNHAFVHDGIVGVRNPYDPRRIAGGSSSGSAAALGGRMALAALGTDTGGSMRIPCALNGCASLRPSWGRYSGEGVIPISRSRDTVGPMALSMEDVALLDAVITGDSGLPSVDLKQLRLGVDAQFWANRDEDTRILTEAAVKLLENAGVTFVEVPDTKIQELNHAIGFPVVIYEAYDDMVAYLRDEGPGISIETLYEQIASPDVKAVYREMVLPRKTFGPGGTFVDAAPIYQQAVAQGRPALKARYQELFDQYRLDAFVFPTTPIVAPLAHDEISLPENFLLLIQNTEPSASANLPSIQLPIGLGPQTKLPVGLELDGPVRSDRRLLAIGYAFEKIFGRLPAAALG